MPLMGRRETVTDNIGKLLYLSKLFDIPIVVTEQFPRWLGPTIPEIVKDLPFYEPIKKMHFNCCEVDLFNEELEAKGIEAVILTGVEAHICLFQTCVSILERGLEVQVPHDAVDSRSEENWRIGLDLMKEAGGIITSTETIIYQILEKAGTREFKEMMKLIR